MSDDSKRRRGGMSRYLNGGASKLVLDPRNFDDPGVIGQWTYEQLVTMNDRFVARVERAIAVGKETGGICEQRRPQDEGAQMARIRINVARLGFG